MSYVDPDFERRCAASLGGSLAGDVWRGATGAAQTYLNPASTANALWNATTSLYNHNFVKRRADVPEEVRYIAQFAAAAYTGRKSRPFRIDSYTRAYSLDSETVAVYIDRMTPRAIVSVRGTATGRDLVDDLTIATSRISPGSDRVREVLRIVRLLPPHIRDVLLTGHSLGATVAATAADTLAGDDTREITAIGFNPGSSPVSSGGCKRCVFHVIAGDLISFSALSASRGTKVMVYEKQAPSLSAHAMQQFLVE